MPVNASCTFESDDKKPACNYAKCQLRAYLIIESGFGFTINLVSDLLGKSNDFRSFYADRFASRFHGI